MKLVVVILCLQASLVLACELSPELWSLIKTTSQEQGLSPHTLLAVFYSESRFCHHAGNDITTSPKGALGIGQLMPKTAEMLGVNPYNLGENIEGAARYLAMQLNDFGRLDLALAAYNAGPGAVIEYGGIPPFDETRGYVLEVLGNMVTYSMMPELALTEFKEGEQLEHTPAPIAQEEIHDQAPPQPTETEVALAPFDLEAEEVMNVSGLTSSRPNYPQPNLLFGRSRSSTSGLSSNP